MTSSGNSGRAGAVSSAVFRRPRRVALSAGTALWTDSVSSPRGDFLERPFDFGSSSAAGAAFSETDSAASDAVFLPRAVRVGFAAGGWGSATGSGRGAGSAFLRVRVAFGASAVSACAAVVRLLFGFGRGSSRGASGNEGREFFLAMSSFKIGLPDPCEQVFRSRK